MQYNNSRQCPANYYPYIIQPGDTLYFIINRFNVSISRILAANPGLNINNLRIGQTICIPSCPLNHTAYIIKPGDTLYRIAQAYNVSVSSILMANPSVEANYLRVGQRICIPTAPQSNCSQITAAMQSDIDMLKVDSDSQKISESNYGNSTKTTRVQIVTATELRFDAAPVTFPGNYVGHFTAGQSYHYYADSASGGQRGINVKDNFGVWHLFGYQVPI